MLVLKFGYVDDFGGLVRINVGNVDIEIYFCLGQSLILEEQFSFTSWFNQISSQKSLHCTLRPVVALV